MTPKEKVEDLLEKFSFLQYDQLEGTLIKGNSSIDLKNAAKQCALIAVDEILNSRPIYPLRTPGKDGNGGPYNFWQQVKQEIEKII